MLRKIVLLCLAFPTLVFAHPTTHIENTFINGLVHPFTGIDHVAILLVVGAIAAIYPFKYALLSGCLVFYFFLHGHMHLELLGLALSSVFICLLGYVITRVLLNKLPKTIKR